MKRSELFFSAIKVPVDYLMLFLAGLTAYYLRFGKLITEIKPVVYQLERLEFIKITVWVALIWLAFFILVGLYKIGGERRVIDELGKIFVACTAGLVSVIILFFFNRDLFSSRFIILFGWGLSLIYISVARLLIRSFQGYLLTRGIGVHRVILIGANSQVEKVAEEIQRQPRHGFKLIGRVQKFGAESWLQLDNWLKNPGIDEVIQADPNLERGLITKLVDYCNSHHLDFKYTADLFQISTTKLNFNTLAGVPLIEIKKTPLDGWGKIYKRIFDIIGSLILIIFTSPIMILTAIAIKLDSKGPIFFSRLDNGQPLKRVGEHDKAFRYFKFRSMWPGTHSQKYQELAKLNIRSGPLAKIKDDPRITRVGKFIRRLSLDEFPEFFLVFKGDMSLVGPRPHEPEEVAKYQDHQRRVLTIKPGITGMAQVSGRSDLNFEEEVKLDIFYIENWSLRLDLQILIKTPLAVFQHRTTE